MTSGVAAVAGMPLRASIRAVVASASLAFMDTYVAKGAGVFEHAGLDVVWQPPAPSASIAIGAVVTGESDVANVATLYAIGAAPSTPSLKIFAAGPIGVTSFLFIRVSTAIKLGALGVTPDSPIADRLRALKGLTIGAGSKGGATELNLRLALQSAGLDPDSDVTLFSGTSDAQLAAFNAGNIDASVQGVLYALQPVLAGTGVIWISGPNGDVPDWNRGYFLCWVTSEEFARSNSASLKRFIAGLRAASQIIKTDRSASLRALNVMFGGLDPVLLAGAFDAQRRAYVVEPDVKKSVLQDVIDAYNASSPMPTSIPPSEIVVEGFLHD